MSQHWIRKNAGYGWAKRAWMKLREPRAISAVYGIWYALLTAVWGRAIINPPSTIEGALGENGMFLVAVTITFGALFGMVTVATGNYGLERTPMKLIALGLAGYLLIVLVLEILGTGNRQPGMASTLGAIALTLLRSYWIYDRLYHPDRRPAD